MAWAEDRAPWRHDPSADPGAKTEGGRHDAVLSFPFGIGTKAANRLLVFRCSVYLISRPRFLHFTLNQHRCHIGRIGTASPSSPITRPAVKASSGSTARTSIAAPTALRSAGPDISAH